jgi:hypothetical protein
MKNDRDLERLRAQIAICQDLAAEFRYGITAQNIKELSEELDQQLREALRTSTIACGES